MKLTLLLVSIIFTFATLSAHEEVLVLEQLIETTQKNLHSQQELLRSLHAYHAARDSYFGDPDSSKRATLLVKKAMKLHTQLTRDHLHHLFSNDFLTELSFYNQVGKGHLAGN